MHPVIGVGQQIDDIELEHLAARTGSSTVYRGTQALTGEHKAVKVLTQPDDAAVRRLEREATLLGQLDHPALVPFHACVRHGDEVVLITDWVDGMSLQEQLRTGASFSVDQSLALVHDLANGLDYLHDQDIVHRDVSPANVILRPDGSPVLIDLGIGHAVGESTMTNHDLVAGTPRYLAPEIIRGETASGRSDQYSLAVLAYELLAGQSPFPAGEALASTLHHQVFTAATPLNELVPELPVHVGRAVDRALEKEPADRFASVAQFSQATLDPSWGGTQPSPAGERQARRRRWLYLGAAAVIGVAALFALILGRTDQASPSAQVTAAAASSIPTTPAAATAIAPDPTAVPTTTVATTPATVPTAAPISLPAALSTWPAGTAASVECNQLQGNVFENGSVPLDYYGNPPARERVIDQGGYGDTWALEVGIANDYGQYGEIVPVTPGQDYVFAGWFRQSGAIADAELGVTLLDAGYQPLEATVSAELAGIQGEFVTVRFSNVPATAAFAIPYLFKDASPGVLIADELVFGTESACGPELQRTGS